VFAPEVIQKLTATNAGPVFDAMISWAESNNGFAIVDTDDGLSVSQATIFVGARQNSSYGAAYYPNFYISDPLGRSPQSLRKVGPAGAIAGIYIATDKQVGPFKAPAGVTATVRGAVALEKAFTSAELDSLNTATTPVNAIRNLPGAGVVVMGARTLKNDGTANKYVNMRRSLIYINKRLKDLTQFALFENNSEVLWGRIRTVLNVFLNEYRNQGGLRGATPADSFFVKCDAENNPAESIALGEVHIEVEYPAEFVVINLSQKTAN
jgi:phage tail sheath protein FI